MVSVCSFTTGSGSGPEHGPWMPTQMKDRHRPADRTQATGLPNRFTSRAPLASFIPRARARSCTAARSPRATADDRTAAAYGSITRYSDPVEPAASDESVIEEITLRETTTWR